MIRSDDRTQMKKMIIIELEANIVNKVELVSRGQKDRVPLDH